jgi:hypothetical protein
VRRTAQPWLPLLLVLGGLVVLGGVAFAVLGSRGGAAKVTIEVQGAPRLKVNQSKVDLGNVPLGQTVEVSFQVSNAGDQPLRLAQTPYVEVVEGC